MIYIADEWLNKKENENQVRLVLEKAFSTDINPDYKDVITELEKLGEHEIVKKLKEGHFAN